MYEFTCKQCGKRVEVEKYDQIRRRFCGKDCYHEWLRLRRNQVAPIERSENPVRSIHPTGYDNLVEGICQRAREDVLHYSPDSFVRQDAERFFRSDFFARLTNLDGEEILRQLHRIYSEKKRRKAADEHGE